MKARLNRTGLEAARRKFTPEFLNRLDKIVVLKALGDAELNRIIDIELEVVNRIASCAAGRPFYISLTDGAREFLLTEGADARRPPHKRAIERFLVQPLSNLIARSTRMIAFASHIEAAHPP